VIIEQGTHQQLIELDGKYSEFVKKQAIDVDQNKISDTFESNDYDAEELLRQEELEVKQLIFSKENHRLSRSMSRNTAEDITDEKDDREGSFVAIDAYDARTTEQERIKKTVKQQRAPVWKVLKHMRQEWNYLGVGIIGSAISGCVFPLYAFCFSRIVAILSVPGKEILPSPLGGNNLFAFLFIMIGIGAFIGTFTQLTAFEVSGEKFTRRLRAQVFAAYLKQEIGFFDLEENNSGALTSRLAVDARNVNEMITKVWGDIASMCTTIISSFAISFSHSWALSLILLCMAPFIVAATAYEFRIQQGFEDETNKANAESSQVAGEAIREVRTVAVLNKQAYFEERYYHATDRPHRLAKKKAYLSSIAGGFGKGIVIYTTALGFFAGSHLIMNGKIDFQQMFTCMIVIIVASEAAGRSTTFASAYSKAKYAAIASYEVIERKSRIDPELEGLEPSIGSLAGDIGFENIKFSYPARSDTIVFTGEFNLKGHAGQSIALVGRSGGGKSTVVGMLQRWYDPLTGVVSLDHNNVSSYSVYNLRSHMALVGQEPVLFDMTIGENIRFGVEDHKSVSQKDVEDACKAANIHTFISGLPQGYDTRVGDKGSQLSGGQKQRIAIARALIRKPKVLLLDEATSALDSDSEKLVQEALDNILREGERTSITIAHRLSTVKNADVICVIKDGRVIEQGNHWELLKLNGVYSDMVHEQSLSVL
jgi:ATP-binding cassette subfamily B (MDR/TAP) protein 1